MLLDTLKKCIWKCQLNFQTLVKPVCYSRPKLNGNFGGISTKLELAVLKALTESQTAGVTICLKKFPSHVSTYQSPGFVLPFLSPAFSALLSYRNRAVEEYRPKTSSFIVLQRCCLTCLFTPALCVCVNGETFGEGSGVPSSLINVILLVEILP